MTIHSHTQRASILYGAQSSRAQPAKPAQGAPGPAPALSGRDAAAAVLYRSGTSGGSIDNALSSTFGRLRAGVTDKETLARLDSQRLNIGKLLREKNVEPADAHKLLSIYVEHKLHKRSDEALEKRWHGPAGYTAVRQDAGSEAAANARLAGTDAVLRAVAKVSPDFARDLVESGASQHADFIATAAKLAPAKPAAQS
jgi:hypothetical protein